MCTPDSNPLGTILNLATGITKEALNYNAERQNNEYKTRLALNNAQIAQNEALRQKQLGIEQSRLEKISGIQEANKQKAISAASNFDVASVTSQINYQDNISMSNYQADVIEEEYNTKAKSYFNQANSYLKQADSYQNQYNNSVFQNALNALGKTAKVSNEWISTKDKANSGGWY